MTTHPGALSRPFEARDSAPETRFDPPIAHPARVHGYLLGGKGNCVADREAVERMARSVRVSETAEI